MMDSDWKSTESSRLDDPTFQAFTGEQETYSVNTQRMEYLNRTQNAYNYTTANNTSRHMMFNSTWTESMNNSFTHTNPTEATVTTEQDNPGRRRRKKRSADVNKTLDWPESRVESQCFIRRCLCSNLTIKNLDYQYHHGTARLTLVGFFPVHGTPQGGRFCSEFNRKQGFEPFMAFKYAVERVNRDPNVLGNIHLG